jgi:hypothetical protein
MFWMFKVLNSKKFFLVTENVCLQANNMHKWEMINICKLIFTYSEVKCVWTSQIETKVSSKCVNSKFGTPLILLLTLGHFLHITILLSGHLINVVRISMKFIPMTNTVYNFLASWRINQYPYRLSRPHPVLSGFRILRLRARKIRSPSRSPF